MDNEPNYSKIGYGKISPSDLSEVNKNQLIKLSRFKSIECEFK